MGPRLGTHIPRHFSAWPWRSSLYSLCSAPSQLPPPYWADTSSTSSYWWLRPCVCWRSASCHRLCQRTAGVGYPWWSALLWWGLGTIYILLCWGWRDMIHTCRCSGLIHFPCSIPPPCPPPWWTRWTGSAAGVLHSHPGYTVAEPRSNPWHKCFRDLLLQHLFQQGLSSDYIEGPAIVEKCEESALLGLPLEAITDLLREPQALVGGRPSLSGARLIRADLSVLL